jgi:two-component system, response regulator PdtaR
MTTKSRPLRIAIADDEPEMLEFYEIALRELGHEVALRATNGRDLLDGCRRCHPDLIITDIKMPDMDGLDATTQIRSDAAIPVILVSAYHDAELIERALHDHVLAYLVKPIQTADLEPTIALVMRRFMEFQALQREADTLRQAMEDRKLVERAKGILMQRAGLSEPDAFRRLQKLSSEKNTKMVDIARMIVTAEEAFSSEPTSD